MKICSYEDIKMKEIVRIFKALSDPTRLRIFVLLMRRDLCVCELMYVLDMPQSRISHQLRLLRDADVVETKRDGKWIIYTVPGRVKKSLEPLLAGASGPEFDASMADDAARLGLCLKENVRRTRGPKTGPRRVRPAKGPNRDQGSRKLS